MKTSVIISKISILALVILLLPANIFAQKGYPLVSPFTFDESIDNDNYDIVQDNYLNILVANRKGILTFDSRNWELLPFQYFPVVLEKSQVDGTVYVGCINGFGRLRKDITGNYNYELLSDTMVTGEISDISITPKAEFFIARNRIYYNSTPDEKISCWEFHDDLSVSGSFVFKDEFYFMLETKGLYKAEDDTFKLVSGDQVSSGSELVFAFETESKEVIAGTNNNQVYIYNGSVFSPVNIKDSEYLKTSIITDGIYLGGNEIAIGTLMGGVLTCNYKTGITTTILNYKTGLSEDEIYCMGNDNNDGLWICNAFGVSRIDNKLKVSNLTWYPGLNGNLTNTAFFDGQLYVGTSDGLYSLKEKRLYEEKPVYSKPPAKVSSPSKATESVSKGTELNKPSSSETLSRRELRKKRREAKSAGKTDTQAGSSQQPGFLERIFNSIDNPVRIFDRKQDDETYNLTRKKVYSLQSISHAYEKVPVIKGKCTEIFAINDHLLVSTYSGLYDINNDQVFTVLSNTYINFINPGPDDKIIYAGGEKSIFVIKLNEGRWKVIHEISTLPYPVYSASMISPSEIWIGSDNAAHKLSIDSEYNIGKDESYLVTKKFSDKVILRNIKGQLYFFLSSGIFVLENNEIKPVKSFEKLSSLPGYYFSGNKVVWYRTAGHWGYIAGKSTENNLTPEYLNIFSTVQDIFLGKEGDLYIICDNKEVFHIANDIKTINPEGFSVFFSGLKGTDDKLFPLLKPKISYSNSSLRIDFSAPFYIAPGKTEFTYRIKGLNEAWSPWSNVSAIEYPLLPPGEYEVQAKARNIFGKESEISSLEILIKPPFWQTTVFYILMIILVFSLFTAIVKFRERNLRKAKLILEQKVRERTAEIEMQKNEIAEQKKEITDSIFYARRIQTAILPSTSMLSSVLSEHFVLFLPKDIVSGDFYWTFVKGDKIVILAADCTGHGVPGAFMSMLGVSFLNEIVSAHKLDSAASILNNLRDHVKATLAQSGSADHARDGMDIALCIIDQKQKKLQYAGAYNPLFMIREGELTEIKADKMPIGWYDLNAEFTNNTVSLKNGDCFYIFSDGFVDQFGGELGKKYLAKPFKNLLLKNHSQPMSKQKELLNEEFETWKGKLLQVDDVLVMGFRI